jgi:hypothetical protein
MKKIVRDTLGIVADSCAKKVKNRGDSPSVDSLFGLVPCQEHGICVPSVNP